MITAVDTSVLLDVFGGDPVHGQASGQALRSAMHQGSLIACEVVVAEVSGFFPSAAEVREAFERIALGFSPLSIEAALEAGAIWKDYRNRGGQRQRVVADFLVGAHALLQADRLLTRDRGFYQGYFGRLKLIDPSKT